MIRRPALKPQFRFRAASANITSFFLYIRGEYGQTMSGESQMKPDRRRRMRNAPDGCAILRRAGEAARRSQALPRQKKKESMKMKSNNRINVPEAKQGMDQFKMQAASEVGVNLKDGYNGDLTSREAGSIGGQIVKKMIESYEQGMK
jgi:small acid-soluble spore protein D (minor alpha/beta-type SASP)